MRKMKEKILLHICCAPDAAIGWERLMNDWEVVGLFYNPNIEPREEYDLRRYEIFKLSGLLALECLEEPPDTALWFELVKEYADEPERGARCHRCIAHRLEVAAGCAAQLSIRTFTTTLTASPHKDVAFIHQTGQEIAARLGLDYTAITFRKQNGYQRSIELSKHYGLYRQNYCGCRWSIRSNSNKTKILP
ncbi:MAG: epoxyqueuosine reductase QueH [Calditrichaeota bacterium]|nr:epoxyqueuosine reductase QueH [Calditrichota bacterium]